MDSERTEAHVDGTVPLGASGWCVLRAFSDKAEYPILDLYPYATTSPVYVSVAGAPVRSAVDASYFVAWIDRLIAATRSNTSWNTEAEKESVLSMLREARGKYAKMAESKEP
jgi:TolB protein